MGEGNQMGQARLVARWLWRALGSTRLAAILLGALLLATALASLLPQMPATPAAREPWLSAVALRYGAATDLIHALGLFQVYESVWYLALLGLLLLNTLICTAQRLPRLWRSLTRTPDVARPETFYRAFRLHSECPVSTLADGLLAVRSVLNRHHYRTIVDRDASATHAHVFAERYRWSQAGTLISHISALVLALAILARPALGWQERGIVLAPGQVYEVGHGQSLSVQAGDLEIDRHPGGQARAYRVSLAVTAGDKTTDHRVGINQPLTHRGITFHLQSYGPAARLITSQGEVHLTFGRGETQEALLPGSETSVQVAHLPQEEALYVVAHDADGDLLGSGQVSDGQAIDIQGSPVTFHLGYYTVWQVSHDPTVGLALGAATLMLAGMVISLWLPHRRLWLLLEGHRVQTAGAGDFGAGDIGTIRTARGFQALAAELARTCQAQDNNLAGVTPTDPEEAPDA